MASCYMEDCPMWDGDGCPCAIFGLDRGYLPENGVFTVEIPDDTAAALDRAHNHGERRDG